MRKALSLAMTALVGCATAASPISTERAPAVEPSHRPQSPPGPCSSSHMGAAGTTTTIFTYDDGRRVRAVETGPEGTRQTLWSYGEDGRRTREVRVDGARVSTRTFHYDRGVLVRTETDAGDETKPFERSHRRYDDTGKLRERIHELRVDGAWHVVDHHALHYTDDGRFAYELHTQTAVGRPRQVQSVTVEVDHRGRVIARHTDTGMDGTLDRVSLYAFDDRGRLATATSMKRGHVESVARHTYADDGMLVRTMVEDASGRTIASTKYDFGCWSSQTPAPDAGR